MQMIEAKLDSGRVVFVVLDEIAAIAEREFGSRIVLRCGEKLLLETPVEDLMNDIDHLCLPAVDG